MGKAAQRGFQTTDHNGRIGEGLPGAVGVDNGGAIGTTAHFAAGTVQIPCAAALGHGIVRHHGVQIAAADQYAVAGLAHAAEGIGVVPIRLGQDRHAISLALQQAGDQRRAEAGVVNIGVCRHHQKIVIVPTAFDHFVAADR